MEGEIKMSDNVNYFLSLRLVISTKINKDSNKIWKWSIFDISKLKSEIEYLHFQLVRSEFPRLVPG